MSSRVPMWTSAYLMVLVLSLAQGSFAQTSTGRRSSLPSGTTANSTAPVGLNSTADSSAVIRTVSGRVLNALTGVPLPRVLVNLNSRVVLTDTQGRFSLAGFIDANGYVQVTKPGFSASPTVGSARQQKITDLDAPVELKLYPDALLTGTVTGPDSLPLARTQVRLYRLTFDTTGARWLSSGFSQTDVHGDFRFDTPAGRYRLSTGYVQRSYERGEAVLPTTFPPNTGSFTGSMELSPGEQRQLSLRPRVGPAYAIQIAVDGSDSERGVRLTAVTPSGTAFQLPVQREDAINIARLPAGTFVLHANAGDREDAMEGEARVVVTPGATAQISIHLTREPEFPVEATVDLNDSTATTPAPSLQQYNLTLHNVANTGEGLNQDSRLTVQPEKSPQFRVQPGRYRLAGGLTGAWYIKSALCGPTDLMSEELAVAVGAGGSPIRLVISNAVGRLKGTVTTAGQSAAGWVYLLPQQPSLIPYSEIYIQPDGTFQWSGPPGRYVAVASSQQVQEDFRDETFLHRFAAAGRDLQITAAADTRVDLTIAVAGVAR